MPDKAYGIHVEADSLDSALAEAAHDFVALAYDPTSIGVSGALHVVCAAPSIGEVAASWLCIIQRRMKTQRVACARFQAHSRNGTVAGVLWCQPVEGPALAAVDVLAEATIADVSVQRENTRWTIDFTVHMPQCAR